MFRIVRRSAIVVALAMATVGFAPSASADPPYGLIKLVFNCASVGDVTATVAGPGVAGSARDDSGSYYFRGRPGVFTVKRLSNGRIAPRTGQISIPPFSTRTIRVCSNNW